MARKIKDIRRKGSAVKVALNEQAQKDFEKFLRMMTTWETK